MKNAIVLLIDGLGAPWIGPYGNTIFETRAFNRLAATSFLAEHMLIDTPRLLGLYDSYLKGGHAGFGPGYFASRPALPDILRTRNISATAVIDGINAGQLEITNTFDSKVVVPMAYQSGLADEVEQTWLAGFFAEAISSLGSLQSPFLCWIHCPGLYAPWDAPYEFRRRLADEEDPEPPTLCQPPSRLLASNCDPDEPHGLACAYGGQIALIDSLLDVLLDSIETIQSETLLMVSGVRGFPLGEHRIVGDAAPHLYSELTRVPLLIQFPGEQLGGFRSQALIQTGDLHATLAAWFDVSEHAGGDNFDLARLNFQPRLPFRQISVCRSTPAVAIRTPCWYAIMSSTSPRDDDAASSCQLFVKPDDRWDANDVASRCPDVCLDVAQLANDVLRSGVTHDLSTIKVPARLLIPPD